MTRRSSFTPSQIAEAITRARGSNSKRQANMLLSDIAARILAGPQASDEAIADAADQVVAWQARGHVEGVR